MNRLVIIGNGFDLAHGMKTSYNDFLLYYFDKCFKEAENSYQKIYTDKLIEVKRNRSYAVNNYLTHIDDYLWFWFAAYQVSPKQNRLEIIQRENVNQKMSSEIDSWAYELTFKSNFFMTLVTQLYNKNWIDIENHYYESLIKVFSLGMNKEDNTVFVNNLNNEFFEIIEIFQEFIKEQKSEYYTDELKSILDLYIDISELVSLTNEDKNEINRLATSSLLTVKKEGAFIKYVKPKATMLLNFNYTSTAEKYISNDNINYIHKKNEKEIIFGFGDEIDENYYKIEKENDNSYFRFIKSFGYFSNSNYHNLIRFIDSNIFEVFIWGHSCGLSDRTMLNTIFEHENCKSIKIFYHEFNGRNNHTELTHEISRHFKDKAQMRKKILSFEKSTPLPQIKK
jgi:hypothetical protein